MGVLVSPKLSEPGVGVLLSSLCTCIVISAMSTHVFAAEIQALPNVTTPASLDNIADDEINTTIIDITSTNTKEVNNHPATENIESYLNTTAVNTTINSSSSNINKSVDINIDDNQNTDSTQATQVLLSEATPKGDETTAQQSEADTNNTPTENATEDWLHPRSVSPTNSEASGVTKNNDLSTLTNQNISGILDVKNCTKASGLGTLGIIVVTCVAVTAVIVMIFVIALIIYFSKGGCCKPRRHLKVEYVDCDHELYTSLNFRHHGARAEYQPLNLKDGELITKMEVDEMDDTDNPVIDVDGPADSGRYVSPEGLVYIKLSFMNRRKSVHGQTKASTKMKYDDNRVQYASVDINKTNKLFMKLQKRERNKKRQTYSKKNDKTVKQ